MSSYFAGITRQHAAHGRVEVAHVRLGRRRRRPPPTPPAGSPNAAACSAPLPDCATTHSASRSRGDQRGRLVDERPDRRDAARPDDLGARDQRAQPVREVDDLLAGDAREEVLVAAGEADDLVREDRADDERDVVLDDRAVEPHVDALVAAAPPTARRSARAGMTPTTTNVAGSHHSWLSTVMPGIARGQVARPGSRGAGRAAASVIAAWVPSATSAVSRVTRPCRAPCTAEQQQRQRAAAGRVRDDAGTRCARRVRAGQLLGTKARTSSSLEDPVRAADRGAPAASAAGSACSSWRSMRSGRTGGRRWPRRQRCATVAARTSS